MSDSTSGNEVIQGSAPIGRRHHVVAPLVVVAALIVAALTLPAPGRSVAGTPTAPSPSPVVSFSASGENAVYVNAVDVTNLTVTLDPIDLFWGADAVAACEEDGMVIEDQEYCNDYYIRNQDPTTIIVPLAADATILIFFPVDEDQQCLDLTDLLPLCRVTPEELARTLVADAYGLLATVTVTAGEVVTIRQIYVP